MPKVSIVIPSYNAMRYLPEAVNSVLRQTFTDFEVLIVDDGSSDHTVEWASQLTEPRVKLISQENKGAAGARNNGIANSQGEYVAFLDADDVWEATKLEKQVKCLDDNPSAGLVHTWIAFIDEQGKATGNVMATYGEGEVWKQVVEYNPVRCGSTTMVRRCCFDTVGVFDQNFSFAEDWEMWIRIASRYSFALIKEPLVYYRQHLNNKSKNYMAVLQTFRKIIDKSFQSVPSELLYLRSRADGRANLHAAWRALYCEDYVTAATLYQQAIACYPQLRYFRYCIRLGLILTIIRWFGTQEYNKVRTMFSVLR